MKKALYGFLGLFVPIVAQAQDFSHCVTGLTNTAKEVNVSTSSKQYLNAIFSQECEANGSWKAKSAGLSVEAVVKAIPLSLTGSYSSSEQAMRNFCKAYSSQTQESTQAYSYEERVVDRALQTFDECVRFTAQGITIRAKVVNLESLAIDITAGVGKPVELQGVSTSKNLTCKGLNPQSKKLIIYKEDTNVTTQDTLSMACVRGPVGDKTKVYDEATLLIPVKNYGTFTLLVPKDARLPVDQASLLVRQIRELEAKTELANAGVNEFRARPKVLAMVTVQKGKVLSGTDGVSFDPATGLLSFPNPGNRPFTPLLTDGLNPDIGYFTYTHFVREIVSRTQVRVWHKTLDTGVRTDPPMNSSFTAVIVAQ